MLKPKNKSRHNNENKAQKIELKRKEIGLWLRKMRIENYTIHDNLSISVAGSVYLNNLKLSTIPYRFKDVSGSFEVEGNRLKSLKNSPTTVGERFSCNSNKLKTLAGAPKSVGHMACAFNMLTTFEGGPEVANSIFAGFNNLTTLTFLPKNLNSLVISNNRVSSLEHIPASLENLDISHNALQPKELKHILKTSGSGKVDLSENPALGEYQAYVDMALLKIAVENQMLNHLVRAPQSTTIENKKENKKVNGSVNVELSVPEKKNRYKI